MTVLNEELSLLPQQWAKEFIGSPQKKLILQGTRLCKRVSNSTSYNRLSPWWMLKSDWDLQNQRSAGMGVSPADLARARQAVRNDWQGNLDQVVHGQLMQSVFGWVGQTRWQPLDSSDPKVVLIGGGQQVCIPNLTDTHIRVVHAAS
jgi:hypothetical protein